MNEHELQAAREDGYRRFDTAKAEGRTSRFRPDDPDLREKNGDARAAEVLGRRTLRLRESSGLLEVDSGLGDGIAADGTRWEIRHTRHARGRLAVYEGEPEDLRYLLITGRTPELEVRGWISGADARNDAWRDPETFERAGWYVPQSALRDLSELRDTGRELVCVDCGETILVHEIPVPFCDPATFRCVFCLDPRHERAQLELVTHAPSPRTEVRNYDPEQAVIPY